MRGGQLACASQQYTLPSENISWYDISVNVKESSDADPSLLETLANFRHELRHFLHFSELAAVEAGLQSQQHQLLLQVAGAPQGTEVTISYAAVRLSLKHNSTVELVDRSEREGLLIRRVDGEDKRRALLTVTPKGRRILARLSLDHVRELNERASRLIKALQQIRLRAAASALEIE
jgi:DNA-binding MarR family transcriptional regulator